ncbi:MAG: hypothetical protein DRQ88_05840 [Epsilonproteobacteria bacterium]|nr:MAG: hypothetical protein DRQ89_11760 [Campylobacterota bacterium]RLA66549.1 MAG: hypothetical protein DRQ88_05840 [Campylobacterota bacterium]
MPNKVDRSKYMKKLDITTQDVITKINSGLMEGLPGLLKSYGRQEAYMIFSKACISLFEVFSRMSLDELSSDEEKNYLKSVYALMMDATIKGIENHGKVTVNTERQI